MNIPPNLTISHLEELLNLHKLKEALLAEFSSLESKIASVFSGKAAPAPKKRGRPPGRGPGRPKGVKTIKPVKPVKPGKTRRGGLKEMILANLQSVGPEGIKVKDLAEKIGVNRKNVEIWFYTTGKKLSEIKKLGPGLFTLFAHGKGAPAPASAPAPKGRRGPRRAKAGSTKERFLAALQAAGPEGISVKELSAKLGIKNQNLHTWFNQTGKKIAGITKVALGRYRMVA